VRTKTKENPFDLGYFPGGDYDIKNITIL